ATRVAPAASPPPDRVRRPTIGITGGWASTSCGGRAASAATTRLTPASTARPTPVTLRSAAPTPRWAGATPTIGLRVRCGTTPGSATGRAGSDSNRAYKAEKPRPMARGFFFARRLAETTLPRQPLPPRVTSPAPCRTTAMSYGVRGARRLRCETYRPLPDGQAPAHHSPGALQQRPASSPGSFFLTPLDPHVTSGPTFPLQHTRGGED